MKVEQLVAGDALGVGGPGAPLEVLRDGRAVAVLHQLQLLILVVDDLEEEHPAKLGDALGVAIDADVLAHDVLDGFDGVADGHGLGGFLVEGGLEFVDGVLEVGAGAELLDELNRRAHRVEGRDLKDAGVVEVEDAFVLVLRQQGFEDGAGLRAILGEDVALADIVGALAAGERRPVEGDVADQVEGIEILADFLGERVERQPFVGQFLDDGLLALGGVPAAQEIIEAGEALPQGLLGEVAQAFGDELAVFVEVFDALGDDGGADAVDVDLLALLRAIGWDGDVGRRPSTMTSSSSSARAGWGPRHRRWAVRRRAG